MQEYTQTVSTVGEAPWVRLDTGGNVKHIYHIMVEFSRTPKNLVDVEFSIQKDLDNAVPVCHNVLQDLNKTTASVIHAPMAGIRLNVKSLRSGGTVTLRVLQS